MVRKELGEIFGVSDIVVVMDEGTSSRPGCKEVSFQGLGPKNNLIYVYGNTKFSGYR